MFAKALPLCGLKHSSLHLHLPSWLLLRKWYSSGSVEFPSLGKTDSTSLWQAFQKAEDFAAWAMQLSPGDSWLQRRF